MQLIGKGSFTKAYRKDKTTVLLKSDDPIKECMSMGWFPDSRLFPKIIRTDFGEYEMKYYEKVSSLKKSLTDTHYEMYKELRKVSENIERTSNIYDGLFNVIDGFKMIKDRRLKEIMIRAVEACSNYGSDVEFEISPRNVAVTKTGKLILLDCFFMKSKALNIRKTK